MWKPFQEVVEKVKKSTTELKKETAEIEKIYNNYYELLRKEKGTPEEIDDVKKVKKRLDVVQEDIRNVQIKVASDRIRIVFVGASSSGKSSLINALLKEVRLPVGFLPTTMCSIEVCTTTEKRWSVYVCEKGEDGKIERKFNLSDSKHGNAIKDLLSDMSGLEHSKARKERGIHTGSIVQVNWPEDQCEILPLNVVLVDTPGFGEAQASMKVVNEWCKVADIIVTVMDPKSPSQEIFIQLVKDAHCEFTFAVFTKWDECTTKAEKEGKDSTQIREKCENTFKDAFGGQCGVFFVDVENATTNDTGFKEFEKKLASSAAIIKGRSLIYQGKRASVETIDISQILSGIVENKKKEKLARLQKKLESLKKESESFKQMVQNVLNTEANIESSLKEGDTAKLLKEFEEGVKKGELEEEMVLNDFVLKAEEKIRDSLGSQRKKLRAGFKKWTEKYNFDLDMNEVLDNIPPIDKQGLSKDEYDWHWDFNVYYTNNYISAGGMLVLATVGILTCGAGYAVSALGGGVVGVLGRYFEVGDKMKKMSPISDYKVRCWRKSLRRRLAKARNDLRELIYEEIIQIGNEITKKLDLSERRTHNQIFELNKETHSFNKWTTQLEDSCNLLKETCNDYEGFLTELERNEEISRSQEDGNNRETARVT